ncbi:MAG: 50S ribosomal protein L29 [Oscillospiraceae bacterium]|nr:50S ribosomal protein L29 [Oscillospiraceae bacterium]
MKASEIRELSKEEIEKKVKELKEELFNLRFQHAINQLDNPIRLKHVRKDIARSLTILRERELKATNNS